VNAERYAELFRAEARERLTEMNNALLAIERGAGPERVSELFRAVHNMKGMSAAMGFQSVRDLSHALEALLEKLRREETAPSPAVIDALFDAVDALESAVVIVSRDANATPDLSPAIEILEELADADDPGAASSLLPTMEWPAISPSHSTPQSAARWTPTRNTPLRNTPLRNTPLRNTPLRNTPAGNTPVRATPVLPMFAAVGTDAHRSVRVDAERLDTLMNLVGELVIARGRLTELVRQSGTQQLAEVVTHASRLIGNLQDEITKSRMVPVGQAFERFERLVRDTAHELGKQVALELKGTDIEVDKSVLDEIGDPVMHLLRNALDHGIESPSERRAAGKPPLGKLLLSAERERSAVVIHVTDDGCGIDEKKVLERARAANLVSPLEEDLTEAQLLALIARPGFSTSARVTRISGRGVGLDVVATKVRSLGGSVELATALGQGTTITIRLPVTLAIIHALLARAAGETYALPITHVVETMVLTPEMSGVDDGREVLSIRGQNIPIVRLRARLGHPPRPNGAGHVVVLDLPERRSALVVDEFIGQQEIVVKPFDAARGMPQLFSGATILSNGAPALILDARGVA
jgi:two-component system chemotaxis sensor kinase CheA